MVLPSTPSLPICIETSLSGIFLSILIWRQSQDTLPPSPPLHPHPYSSSRNFLEGPYSVSPSLLGDPSTCKLHLWIQLEFSPPPTPTLHIACLSKTLHMTYDLLLRVVQCPSNPSQPLLTRGQQPVVGEGTKKELLLCWQCWTPSQPPRGESAKKESAGSDEQ